MRVPRKVSFPWQILGSATMCLPKIRTWSSSMYPEVGFTKGQLIDYYARIAPVVLPHLKDRPLTLKRYPNGVNGMHFYEKNCPEHRPDFVQVAPVWSPGNNKWMNYCLGQDMATLVWAANLADIELHTSLSRSSDMAFCFRTY